MEREDSNRSCIQQDLIRQQQGSLTGYWTNRSLYISKSQAFGALPAARAIRCKSGHAHPYTLRAFRFYR
jgi:hypothetical protein